jgi:hypothetical protein
VVIAGRLSFDPHLKPLDRIVDRNLSTNNTKYQVFDRGVDIFAHQRHETIATPHQRHVQEQQWYHDRREGRADDAGIDRSSRRGMSGYGDPDATGAMPHSASRPS